MSARRWAALVAVLAAAGLAYSGVRQLSRPPSAEVLVYNQGVAHLAAGRVEEALLAFGEVRTLAPHQSALDARATYNPALLLLGRHPPAAEALLQARLLLMESLRAAPGQPDASRALERVLSTLEQMGRSDDPGSAELRELIGREFQMAPVADTEDQELRRPARGL